MQQVFCAASFYCKFVTDSRAIYLQWRIIYTNLSILVGVFCVNSNFQTGGGGEKKQEF